MWINILLWIFRAVIYPTLLYQTWKSRKFFLWFVPLIVSGFFLGAEYCRYLCLYSSIQDVDVVMASAFVCMFCGLLLFAGWLPVYFNLIEGKYDNLGREAGK